MVFFTSILKHFNDSSVVKNRIKNKNPNEIKAKILDLPTICSFSMH